MAATAYRPEIDGLRALAVVSVVLFHLQLGFPGGYVGVDVFFVISGFLITSIIRRGVENDTFSLAEFWERRIRRILPALFVVVIATLAVGHWLLLPNELEELGKSSTAQALLLANVYFWQDTGYFAAPAEFKPLLHTWSLAVEEQFYLFFPLALCFLRRLSRRHLLALLALVAVLSFTGSVYGAFSLPVSTFFLLPTRAWELLIGCMLAVLPWQCESSPRRDSAIATLGVLAIALPVFLYDSTTPFPGLAAAPPVLGTAAIIFATACTPGVWLCKALSLRPVVFIGLVSYSLYLWHWPTIVYTRLYFGHFHWKQCVFASTVSLSLAVLSWRFIETPCRRNTFVKRRRRLFGLALSMSGATVAVSMFLIGTDGLPSRFPNYVPALKDDLTWAGGDVWTSPERLDFATLPTLGVERNIRDGEARLDFLLWGDSHAAVLCDVIDEAAAQHGLSGKAICVNGQVPLLSVCTPGNGIPEVELRFRQQVAGIIRTRQPRHLLLVCRWSWYTNGYSAVERASPGTEHLHTDSPSGTATPETNLTVLRKGLRELVALCEDNEVTLWIVQEVPEANGSSPARDAFLVSVGRRRHLPDYSTTPVKHRVRQESVQMLFSAALPRNTRMVDPSTYLFRNGELIVFDNGRSLYRDSDHLTRHGAESLKELFSNIMRDMK